MKLYLYFNDLSSRARCSKQSPRSVPKKVKEQPIAPVQRVGENIRGQAPRSRDASVAEESFLKRSVDAPAASTVRREGLLNTITSRGSLSRNRPAIGVVCFRLVPGRDRRAQRR